MYANQKTLNYRSYVIRSSRMSVAQRRAYSELYHFWVLPNKKIKIDWTAIFGKDGMRVVEIGFGMGEATKDVAHQHPDWNILAIEVHRPGIGKLLWYMEKENLRNIRIIEENACEVIANRFDAESIDAFHLWFPDPWPKKRHHKRRLIQADFVEKMATCLNIGGYIHIATDWEEYAKEIIETLNNTASLKNRYKKWAQKTENRPKSKFERSAISKGLKVKDIIFEKYNR